MKYYSIPLTLTLTACGTPSTSPSDPASQECKGNRIWSETQGECIEPIQDATLEDAIIEDAGYTQKYEGKLYGVRSVGAISQQHPDEFVMFDFKTGMLRHLVTGQGAIIEASAERSSIQNPSLSPNGQYIISLTRGNSNEPFNVNLLNINQRDFQMLYATSSLAHFAWLNDHTYYTGLSEKISETNWKTRLYQKSIDGHISDWVTEIDGKNSIGAITIGLHGDIEFRCRGSHEDLENTNPTLEVCWTFPTPLHGSYYYDSDSVANQLPFTFETLYWPNQNNNQIFVPCAKDGVSKYLCTLSMANGRRDNPIQIYMESTNAILSRAVFDPTNKYAIFGSSEIVAIQEKRSLGSSFLSDLRLDGELVTEDITWFAWRDD